MRCDAQEEESNMYRMERKTAKDENEKFWKWNQSEYDAGNEKVGSTYKVVERLQRSWNCWMKSMVQMLKESKFRTVSNYFVTDIMWK